MSNDPRHSDQVRQRKSGGSTVITILLILLGAGALLPGLCVAVFDPQWGSLIVGLGWITVAVGAVRITWRILPKSWAQDVGVSPTKGFLKLASVCVLWGALFYGLHLLLAAISTMQQQVGHIRWN